MISNCWTLDKRMLGSPDPCLTPLARVGNLSCPHIFGRPFFFALASQNISGILFGDRNPALLHKLIADCLLRNDYSVQLIILDNKINYFLHT
jgi:hypothetical protein